MCDTTSRIPSQTLTPDVERTTIYTKPKFELKLLSPKIRRYPLPKIYEQTKKNKNKYTLELPSLFTFITTTFKSTCSHLSHLPQQNKITQKTVIPLTRYKLKDFGTKTGYPDNR